MNLHKKYAPLDYSPLAAYDSRYWTLALSNVIDGALRLGIWTFYKVPTTPNLLKIQFCGNPNCLSPFGYRNNNYPTECIYCNSEIDWTYTKNST